MAPPAARPSFGKGKEEGADTAVLREGSNGDSGGGRRLLFFVTQDEAGLRLDLYLAGKETGLSRAQIQKAIQEQRVVVDGEAAKAGRKVKAGQEVGLYIPAPRPAGLVAQAIPLNILYEDDFLLVLDKPAGMVVHPAAGHPDGTLVNALLHHCRDLSGIGGELRPGIVHRLDKGTSGLMVVAKSDAAHRSLAGQFKHREVNKTYLAVVYGEPQAEEGRIEAAVGRHPTDRKRMSTRSRRGREALSSWRLRERFGVASLLEVRIETGRTHQIRVHLAALGHPVVGDAVYGGAGRFRTVGEAPLRKALEAMRRPALHAWRLSFLHPETGERLEFTAEPPPDLKGLCDALRGRGDE